MKKYISYLLTLALLVPVFVSCTQERDFLSRKQKTHTVHFATSDPATRTGLTIEDNMVKPDWRKTDLENIHFFEIDATNAAAPGTADEISLSDDNRTAHFKAAISDEIIINVPTSSDATASGTSGAKGTGVSPYTFAAVVAQMPDKDAFTFVIPSEQHPDAETLKDPNAEFLVGYSRKSYDAQYDYDSDFVDLYFDRVAALGRLAISGFVGTGEKVKSVTIIATGGMTGKATYPGDFTLGDKNKVNFIKVDEPLVLNYGDGVAVPVEDPFYAYFVVAPGEATVTSIEILTDQYKYTKTVEQGAKFTFSDEQLLNIDFALSEEIAEAVTEDNNTWYKASVLEDGYDYIIVSGGQALKNNGNTTVVAAQSMEIVDNMIISPDPTEGIIWRADNVPDSDPDNNGFVLADYGTHTLSNGSEHLWRHSNNGTFTLEASSADISKYMIWNYDGEHLTNHSIYVSSGSASHSDYFAYYSGGWSISTTENTTMLFTNRPPVEISFASAEAKYDLDNEEWTVAIPELTAPEGAAVTYSSSDEDIATVDADGTVTPKAAGSVRITATVAGNDEHQGGSAYYELIITTSKITTWYKADGIDADETYLIVSNGHALRNNNGTVSAVENEAFSNDSFQYEADGDLLWKATSANELTNDGKYLRLSSSNTSYTVSIGSKSGTTSNNTWYYEPENNLLHAVGGSNNYYVYYSSYSSTQNFTLSTSPEPGSTSTHNTTLYSTKQPLSARNLSFGNDPVTVTHDLANGMDVNEPELTGDSLEEVTYASENEQIATVNPNTGAVILTGKTGSVKITASAQKTDTYKAESVSYTLIVENSNIPTKTYNKVTSTGDLTVGDQYLLVYESTPSVFKPILDGSTFKKHKDNVQSVTISSNSITSTELVDYELTLTEGYHLYVGSANMYLYPNLDGSTTSIGAESSPSIALNITIQSDGIAKITNSTNTTANLCWSTNNSYFSTTYNSSAAINVCLYKLEDNRPAWTMSYSPTEATYDLYTRQWTSGTPSLSSNATTTVTYTSSNENVATVNASGVVTPIKKGSATITATADADATHKKTEASFALTVDDTTPVTMVTVNLKKATSISAGKQYVLVSNGKALVRNGSDAEVYDFNSSDLTVSVPSNLRDNLEWTLQSSSNLFKNGDYYFGIIMHATGTYTYRVGLSNTTTNVDGVSYDSMPNLTIDTSGDYIYYTGNSSAYFMYYDATWTTYKITKANSYTHSNKTALYVVDDGSGDDPTPTGTTYSPASSIVAGQQYLIVSSGKALQNGGGSAAAIDVTVSSGNIILDAPASVLWTAVADNDGFYFINNDQYLRRPSSGSTVGVGTKSSTDDNNEWYYDADNQRMTVKHTSSGTGNTTTYYLSYNSSWQISTTAGNTVLYTANPG